MAINFCTKCGFKLSPNSLFCSNCGAGVAVDNPDIQNSAQEITGVQKTAITSSNIKANWDKLPKQRKVVIASLVTVLVSGLLVSSFSNNFGNNSSVNGEISVSQNASQIEMSEVPGESTGFSCLNGVSDAKIVCMLAIDFKNTGNTSLHFNGNVYALVNGKSYIATTTYGGTDYISTEINPGESQATTVAFEVDSGATLSDVFIADSADNGLKGAKASLRVNKVAVVQ